jgi:RNase P subunit RPR2
MKTITCDKCDRTLTIEEHRDYRLIEVRGDQSAPLSSYTTYVNPDYCNKCLKLVVDFMRAKLT